jgi:response regulator RpfG family c-di-GMP phosphodiesterase
MKYNILIVDDELANLRLLQRLFSSEHNILTAESGEAALEIVKRHELAMIITDQRMPGMTGVDLLKRASEHLPHTVRIILTGYTDAEALVDAINSGVVYKYVTKPWINSELKVTVQRGLQHHETMIAQRDLQQRLVDSLIKLDSFRRSVAEYTKAILSFTDPEKHGKAVRACEIAKSLSTSLDLSTGDADALQILLLVRSFLMSSLSGIAYRGVGPAIKDKAKLETILKELLAVPFVKELVPALRHLSENFDGSGFPDRLAGENIPLLSRIASVVIAYEELKTIRRDTLPVDRQSIGMQLKARAGTKLDPKIVDALIEDSSLSLEVGPTRRPPDEYEDLQLDLSFTEELDRAIRTCSLPISESISMPAPGLPSQ